MSSRYAIEISGLGKSYQIYAKPSDRLKQMLLRGHRQYYKEFWALRDVSLSVNKGETVGIIGRNGSGKSTLLQMICGTLNPTAGHIKVKGKIAALLELGAGFNPEFSGVENVYMAASLYGLSKEEIDQRFDAIAEFADIGDHIHQAVKTYSSGMYVRLAFAVVAHVDAEILVVDEALAVGDAVFTQKCMRFIRKFKENGTLLFVSHDMGSVLSLCERVLWLDHGELHQIGSAKEVSEAYMRYTLQKVYGQDANLQAIEQTVENQVNKKQDFEDAPSVVNYESKLKVHNNLNNANGWKTGSGEIESVTLTLASGECGEGGILQGGEIVKISIKAIIHEDIGNPILGFLLRDKLGQDLFGENTLPFTDCHPINVKIGDRIEAEFIFKLPMLPNGDYSIMASLAEGNLHSHIQHHWLHDSLIIHVSSSKIRWGLIGIEFKAIEFKKI